MDKISSKHLMFIIWGTSIVSIKTNVNIFLKDAGRESWIAIIISSAIGFLYFLYVMNVLSRNNYNGISELYMTALGRTLGTILLIPFVFNLFLTLLESSAVEANSMHTNIFLETPHWYLLIFIIIPAIYTVKKGLIPVVTVAIIGIILAMLAGINLVILTAKYKEYKLLLPVFSQGVTIQFFYGVLKALGLYGSVAICFPYIKYIYDRENIKKYSIVAVLVVIQMHIVSITGAIVSFGIERAQRLLYPKLIQTQQVNYFGFLESGELFVMFQIIGGWFMKYILTFFALLKILEDLKVKNKYYIYFLSAVIYPTSYFISRSLFTLSAFLNFYCYASLVNFIILPMAVLTVANIRKKDFSPNK